jgi:hypothetical protein
MNSRHYIYRVIPKSAAASPYWTVMVNNKAGKAFKRFVDAKYGGESEALAAAEKHRDAVVVRLGLAGRVAKPDSPHPGVSRTESVIDRDGYPRTDAYWQAYWIKADGNQATRRFSIKKHGEEQAKKLAIAARVRADAALKAGVDPFFELPPARAALWRYMDFTKFLAMLEDKALFFSSSNNFEDPFEGAYSLGNVFKRGFVMSRSTKSKSLSLSAPEPKFVISCWYAAKHESAAMWSIYSKTSDAIAIRTTVKRLRASLPIPAQMGLVKYVDYTHSWIPEDTPVLRYFHKRISFQHEHELRAVVDLANPQAALMGSVTENGLKAGVDLNYLIEEIFIGPKSSDWFVDLVRAVCKRYGIKAEPTRSPLYDGPVL